MDDQLTITAILDRAERLSGHREVVTRLADRSFHRYGYADLAGRARRLASALSGLGLEQGTRVGTLCWSHYQHAEVYYAAPIAGLVTHPINPRLHPDDIAYIIDHAGDEVLILDESLRGLYDQVRERVSLRHVFTVGDGYEQLLSQGDPAWVPPPIDEHTPALVTYTSGTTGRPKGVAVSHRAIAIHALSSALRGWLAIADSDVVMPVVPMFHALAWGWPYTAALLGAKLVLPGPLLDPVSLLEDIQAERVTLTGGVPTIWTGVLQELDAEPGRFDVSSLRAVLSGGATAAPALIEGYRQRHGLPLVHTWGMSELMMGVISEPAWDLADSTVEEQQQVRAKQGRPMPFLDIRARGESGLVPWDGRTPGELEVRGPWVATEYLGAPQATAQQWTGDGWFRTGDIVTIDGRGYLHIVDRAKDLIKSGGEWIPTPELESALAAHPAVAEAAVIGIPDEKWTERPLAVVTLRPGVSLSPEELRAFLADQVPKWWLPDHVEIVGALPKTAVGKLDKVALRTAFPGSGR